MVRLWFQASIEKYENGVFIFIITLSQMVV